MQGVRGINAKVRMPIHRIQGRCSPRRPKTSHQQTPYVLLNLWDLSHQKRPEASPLQRTSAPLNLWDLSQQKRPKMIPPRRTLSPLNLCRLLVLNEATVETVKEDASTANFQRLKPGPLGSGNAEFPKDASTVIL